MTPSALLHPNTEIKVAMILFLTAWVVLCLILGLLVQKRAEIHKGECRILSVVGVSAVLILVRLVYVLLVFFKADKTFNMLNGNMTVLLVMSVLEETGVVVLCLGVGLTLRVRGGGTGAGAGATKEELAYSHVPLVETGYQPYGQR